MLTFTLMIYHHNYPYVDVCWYGFKILKWLTHWRLVPNVRQRNGSSLARVPSVVLHLWRKAITWTNADFLKRYKNVEILFQDNFHWNNSLTKCWPQCVKLKSNHCEHLFMLSVSTLLGYFVGHQCLCIDWRQSLLYRQRRKFFPIPPLEELYIYKAFQILVPIWSCVQVAAIC